MQHVREMRNTYNICSEIVNGRECVGNLGHTRRIILKCILEK
jgi:hypothetical protein